MKKKVINILCIILVLSSFFLLALGSSSSKDDETKAIVDAKDDKSEADKDNETEATTEKVEAVEVSIEEQVLVDQDGVKITATGLEDDSIWGLGVKLLIENNSEKNLTVGCNALIVNNYMITDLFAASVAAGKKSNETMSMSSSALEAAGIQNIGQIEIYFHVYEDETWENLFDTECITIKTSEFANMDVKALDDGKELVNQDGIRIVGKFVDENSFWGSGVLVYIENTSGKNVTITCDDMSINGFMVTPYFYSTIYDSKMAIDTILISSSDLEENNIESIDEVELSFRANDEETYKEIFKTDPIIFSAK